MNILITGGTSTIGKAIVMEFAHGNSLFLLSRDTKSNKLQELKEKALSLGSESVTFLNEDLGNYLDDKIDNIIKYNYDLFINIALFCTYFTFFSIKSRVAIVQEKYIKRMLFKALLNKGALPLRILGGVPKRSNGAGCKPVDFGLRRFESFPLHHW